RCAVGIYSWRATDRLVADLDRAESLMEGGRPPRLNGGEARAEQTKQKPYAPVATRIKRFLSFLFMAQYQLELSARALGKHASYLHTRMRIVPRIPPTNIKNLRSQPRVLIEARWSQAVGTVTHK